MWQLNCNHASLRGRQAALLAVLVILEAVVLTVASKAQIVAAKAAEHLPRWGRLFESRHAGWAFANLVFCCALHNLSRAIE